MPGSNYVNTNSLNMWLQGSQSVTLPNNVYVGLFLTNPTSSGVGTEVTGGGYARTLATFGTPSQSGESMIAANANEIVFPEATASWGTPQYFALYDAATGGHMLFYGSLPTTFEIVAGMTPRFAAGMLTVSAT